MIVKDSDIKDVILGVKLSPALLKCSEYKHG